jgi:hypothetical protein
MLSAEVPVFRLLFCLRAVPRLVDMVEDKVSVFGNSPTLYSRSPCKYTVYIENLFFNLKASSNEMLHSETEPSGFHLGVDSLLILQGIRYE